MAGRKRKNPLIIKLYSVKEISKKYDFHPNTVRLWIHRDKLRCYRKGPGGKIMIREDDLTDFLNEFYEP